jgi:ketosteroid isomerase-like protein
MIRGTALLLLLAVEAARADGTPPPAAEARALIDRWVAAQNAGDFAAYQALYAAGFTGVRRSGSRTVNLDRAGWMKDRERMFKKKIQVAALEPEIATDGASATFTQTFESGTFRDKGRKRMAFAREGAGLLIAHEEMLESAVQAGPPPPLPPDDPNVALLRALYPRYDARTGRTTPGGVTRVERAWFAERKSSPPQVAALVELRVDGEDPELELAVLARGEKGPSVLGRERSESPFDPETSYPGRTWTRSYQLVAEAVAIAPAEQALGIAVDFTSHENGPNDGRVLHGCLLLYRLAGAKVRPILELETSDDTGDAECPSGTSSDLTAGQRLRGGHFDLLEKRRETTSHWKGGNDCHLKERTTTRTHRWTGDRYE